MSKKKKVAMSLHVTPEMHARVEALKNNRGDTSLSQTLRAAILALEFIEKVQARGNVIAETTQGGEVVMRYEVLT